MACRVSVDTSIRQTTRAVEDLESFRTGLGIDGEGEEGEKSDSFSKEGHFRGTWM